MSEMKAGRDLDALVAEKVMGWKKWSAVVPGTYAITGQVQWSDGRKETIEKTVQAAPTWESEPSHYSTDIAAAWEVVEKLRLAIAPEEDGKGWTVAPDAYYLDTAKAETAPTAPLAICLAALKAVGAV